MTILRKIGIFVFACTLALSIFSCKAEIDTSSQNKDENTSKTPVTDIKLDKTQLTLLIGKSETLTATISPENATNKSITWKSSAPNIAKVEKGKITALAEGQATITVTTEDNGKTASCTVSVIEDGIILTFKDGDTILTTLNGKKESEISAPPVPTKTGYKFKNWEPALPEKFPATDTIYTATWTANKYTIKFDTNSGTGTPMDDLSLVYDEPHELPQNVFSKEGYEFIGWSKNPDTPKEFDDKSKIINLSSEDNAVVTLYAKWIREGDYTINYVLNDGTNNPTNPDSYNIESDTIVLDEPTKLEYVFEGWFADSAFTNKITQIEKGSTGNITLYAKWTYITYSINYELNGGTNNSNNPASYNMESNTIVLGEPTKTERAFEGWFTDSDFTNQITQIEKGSTGNITIYAKWNILGMSFEKTSCVLVAGKSETLKVIIPPEEYNKITWTSSNTFYASVDENGEVTANPNYDSVSLSEVKITAKYDKFETKCTVKVISKTLTQTTFEKLCNSTIKKFEIPDGITSIGHGAFYFRPNLTSITIPSSITSIGDYAFWNCKALTSITIPDSVTSIGDYAFKDCTSLTSINIPDSVTSIGDYAFSGCSSLTSITIPDSVTSIGYAVFSGCEKLTDITIPNSVSIDGIFAGCTGLKSVTIPDSMTSIGDYAFSGCSSLTSITIPDSVTSIGQNAFEGCTSLTSITIPDSVTSIGDYAFRNCTSLNSITIPDGVTSIGDYAFWNCTNLTNITIPNGVTSINSYAFENCINLISITIPDSLTSIGAYAFKGCTSLTSITIPCNVTNINSYAFLDSSLANITLQQGMASICNSAFSSCTTLISINIPDSVISIGDYAFYGCTNLANIAIPNSVTSIGKSAFYGCTNLTSVTISGSVTSISEKAFSGCSSLTSITIPDSVTSISEKAFSGCSSLTSITIPDSVTSIGNAVFSVCSSLTSVTIPNSVTYIGEGALFGCPKLETVHFDDTNNWKYKTKNETTGKFEFVNTAVFVNDTQNALNLRIANGYVQDWSYGMQKN